MAFSDPHHNLDQFGLHEGQVVADLGVGSGFYALEAARLVRDGGKVYAVDIQQDILVRLQKALAEKNLKNVYLIHADIEQPGGTKIADNHVDVVLLCNIFFQLDQKEATLGEVKRILRSGGRVLFIDWTESWNGMGPEQDQVVSSETARQIFTQAGFTVLSAIDAGDHHYGIIFRKS